MPLAERLRPKSFEEWVGQKHLLQPNRPLYEAIKQDNLFSFVLYAPPGCGKTSLCEMIRNRTRSEFVSLNAVTTGVKDLKAVIDSAKHRQENERRDTVVFIDEIHRFNKSQQDVLLASVEKAEIILLGATTENPSFELNSALLSRLRVFEMKALSKQEIEVLLERGKKMLQDEQVLEVEDGALRFVAELSKGDARVALNAIESLAPAITKERVAQWFESSSLRHDASGVLHYQVVSAFIKSMRAGETEAALYYLARLWKGGEDPRFIARRMVIFASEDIGNADIRGLAVANAVRQAVEFVGRPECYYALSQGVLFLSQARKSREAGERFQRALEQVESYGNQPPPGFLVNAVTALDRQLGRGRKAEDGESFLPKEKQ